MTEQKKEPERHRDGRKEALEIIEVAKAKRIEAREVEHSYAEIDTVLLPADKMFELRTVAEWLRFNAFEVVFTRFVPAMDSYFVGRQEDGYPVAFGAVRIWDARRDR